VLSLFRLIAVALALPFLMAAAIVELSPAAKPNIASLHATLAIAEAKLPAATAKVNGAVAKRTTAELEDGPEGEEEPVANLVRAYDGDDQIETQFAFVMIAFSIVAWAPNADGTVFAQSHDPCAGFPTGPPTA
jgi:hypothetical protein